MKWLFALFLAVVVFGGAAFFAINSSLSRSWLCAGKRVGEEPVRTMPDYQPAGISGRGKIAAGRKTD